MADRRKKQKGRTTSGSFIAIPHAVIEHENYASLSFRARSLLWDLYAQFRGKNNGDLCASWTVMKQRGWKSNDQLDKAKKELLSTGWIIMTRQGGLNLGPSLYAVTFRSIDECGGKLDCSATRIAPGYWRLGYNPEMNQPVRHAVQTDPSRGAAWEKIA